MNWNRRGPQNNCDQPADIRLALERYAEKKTPLNVIALTPSVMTRSVFENIPTKFPALGTPRVRRFSIVSNP